MNILWLSHFLPYPPKAGQILRSLNLIKELARNHRVHLLALNQKALHPTKADVASAVSALSNICASVRVLDVPCERSRMAYYSMLLSNLVRNIPYSVQRIQPTALGDRMEQIIRDHTIDLVHFDTIELAHFMERANGIVRTMTHHNIESELLKRRALLGGHFLYRWYLMHQAAKLKSYELSVLSSFDHNLTVSDLDKAMLEEMIPGMAVMTISNGVDTEFFQPREDAEVHNRLAFVGNMGWFPNHDAATYFVREIWSNVRSQVSDATLHLIGPGEESIKSLGTEPQVTVTGLVEDIRPHLHEAAVVLVPIRVGGGTRLKILDAMASGKAIVSTRIGCEGIDAKHDQHILFADTPDEFARQVVRALSDAELRKSLGTEGRALVEKKYGWRSIGAKMNALYESLSDGR